MLRHYWKKLPKEGKLDVIDRYKCTGCKIVINCKFGELPDPRMAYLVERKNLCLFEDCGEQQAWTVHNS